MIWWSPKAHRYAGGLRNPSSLNDLRSSTSRHVPDDPRARLPVTCLRSASVSPPRWLGSPTVTSPNRWLRVGQRRMAGRCLGYRTARRTSGIRRRRARSKLSHGPSLLSSGNSAPLRSVLRRCSKGSSYSMPPKHRRRATSPSCRRPTRRVVIRRLHLRSDLPLRQQASPSRRPSLPGRRRHRADGSAGAGKGCDGSSGVTRADTPKRFLR